MKKVLSLVLAVMMMSTFAFAVDFGAQFPGEELALTATDFGLASGTDLTTDNYTVSKINWTDGRNLVASVKIKDSTKEVIVALKDNFTLEKDTTLAGKVTIKMKKTPRTDYTVDVAAVINNAKENITLDDVKDEVSITADEHKVYTVKAKQGYGTLSFGSSDFEVEGRVYDKEKLYLYADTGFDKDVLLANEEVDADIYFLSFPGKPSFKGLQTVSLYVEEGTKVYENKDGKLTEIKGKYDKETNAFVFTTRTLGDYVWAEKALKSVAGSTTAPSEGNPDTGANDVVGIATALAAVALVSAAAISLKK